MLKGYDQISQQNAIWKKNVGLAINGIIFYQVTALQVKITKKKNNKNKKIKPISWKKTTSNKRLSLFLPYLSQEYVSRIM